MVAPSNFKKSRLNSYLIPPSSGGFRLVLINRKFIIFFTFEHKVLALLAHISNIIYLDL